MDISETTIKEDIENLMASIRKLLPRKKENVCDIVKPSVRHLSNIHVEAKNVFPKCFHGAKLTIENQMFEKVRVLQQYDFGNTPKTHRAVMRILQKEPAPRHVDDGLLLDSARSATATYTEKIQNGEVKVISKIKNLTSSETEVLVEKGEDKYISSTSFRVKDVNPITFGVLTQYMYKITPQLCFGGEFGFKPFSSSSTPKFSISCRYDLPSFALSYTISRLGLQICVFKEVAKDLRLASIVTENVHGTTLSIAVHKIGVDESDLKMFVDSTCCAGVTYEKTLLFQDTDDTRAIKMKVSTMIDRQARFRYGLGFNLDF